MGISTGLGGGGLLPGLVLVGKNSATSGTTCDVTYCLSSAYDTYRVVVSDIRIASGGDPSISLLDGTTANSSSWTFGTMRYDYGANGIGYSKNTGVSSVIFGRASTVSTSAVIDISGPSLAQYTNIFCHGIDDRGTTGYLPWITTAQHSNAVAYNGVRFTSTQTITNVVVRVYGYRN